MEKVRLDRLGSISELGLRKDSGRSWLFKHMRLKVDQLARTAIDQEQELLSRVHLELCEACGSRLGSSEGLC